MSTPGPVRPGLHTIVVRALLGLLGVALASTALIQNRQYADIAQAFDPRRIGQLVRFNWIRVVAWTGRSVVAWFTVLQLGT